MGYSAPLSPTVDVACGDYPELAGAHLVIITAGVNEKAGAATDRSDPGGRLQLLQTNAAFYRDIVPRVVEHAPQAVLMVVTDPPDPLADLTRELAGQPDYAVTLSLVSVLGRDGVQQMHQPQMSDDEQAALQRSVATLQAASQACRSPGHTTPTG